MTWARVRSDRSSLDPSNGHQTYRRASTARTSSGRFLTSGLARLVGLDVIRKRLARLHVEIGDRQRVFLNELAARLDLVAHQPREQLVGVGGVVDLDPEQRARLRVQRGLPELFGVHLAQPLVALHRKTLAPGGENGLEQR